MTNPNKYYVLYWTGVAHLIKDIEVDDVPLRRSLCGKAEGQDITWNALESLRLEHRPRKCGACTRIAQGIQGK